MSKLKDEKRNYSSIGLYFEIFLSFVCFPSSLLFGLFIERPIEFGVETLPDFGGC